MTFHWPHLFWLLALPAIFGLAEIGRRVRATVRRHPKIMRAEASPSGLQMIGNTATTASTVRVRWRLWLGLALVICALTRPQWGEIEEPVFEQSREILIAIDLSRSMLAPDVAPTRLERSKLLTTSLLDRLEGERVGLIVFAGTAFLQSPLSADYEILEEFLPALDPNYLPEGGTEYAALLDAALEAFSKDSGADRYLIILSDGESQTTTWESRVAELRERGIHVIGLGVGTAAGAMLPDGAGGFVKDPRGAVVLSRLNPATLEDLARRTNGVYRDASTWVDLADLLQQTVEAGRQGEFAETRNARRIERFQWALAPGILLLLWSVWREFPVQPRQRAVTIKAARRAAAIIAVTTFLIPAPDARAVERVDAGGNKIDDPNHILEPLPDSYDVIGNEPPPPPEAPVREVVGRLAGQAQVAATDYSELANQTLTYGLRQKSTGQKLERSAVYDALDAVDAGEALDQAAADWPALRQQLNKLLEDDEQQQQDQQNQDQQNDQQDQENQDDQQQQQNGGGENDQDQSQDGDNGDQDQQQENSGQNGEQGDQGEQGQDGQQNQSGENGEGQDQDSDQPPQQDGQDGDQGEDQQNKDPAGQDAEGNEQEHRPPENRESAFGDLDEPEQPPESQPEQGQQPQPQSQTVQDPGNQTVGGQATRSGESSDNPALAVPLQKLDQLKQKDSPAQLFQLMQDPAKAPPKTGRDW